MRRIYAHVTFRHPTVKLAKLNSVGDKTKGPRPQIPSFNLVLLPPESLVATPRAKKFIRRLGVNHESSLSHAQFTLMVGLDLDTRTQHIQSAGTLTRNFILERGHGLLGISWPSGSWAVSTSTRTLRAITGSINIPIEVLTPDD